MGSLPAPRYVLRVKPSKRVYADELVVIVTIMTSLSAGKGSQTAPAARAAVA